MQTFLMIAAGATWFAMVAYLLRSRTTAAQPDTEYTRVDLGPRDDERVALIQSQNAAARHALGLDVPVTEIVPLPPKEWRVPVHEKGN